MPDNLLNCPFCGMSDIRLDRTVTETACGCRNCGATIVRDADDKQTPDIVWNTRVPDKELIETKQASGSQE